MTAILLVAFFSQALKEIGIPSPGLTQSLLMFAGYQLSRGNLMMAVGIIFFSFLGGFSGASVIFFLARVGANKLPASLERFLALPPEVMEKARNKISTHSFWAVSVGRSIPGLMVPTSVVAGLVKMPVGIFLTGIVFQLSLWIIGLAALGSTFGHFTPQLKFSTDRLYLSLGVLIMIDTLVVIFILARRKRANHTAH